MNFVCEYLLSYKTMFFQRKMEVFHCFQRGKKPSLVSSLVSPWGGPPDLDPLARLEASLEGSQLLKNTEKAPIFEFTEKKNKNIHRHAHS